MYKIKWDAFTTDIKIIKIRDFFTYCIMPHHLRDKGNVSSMNNKMRECCILKETIKMMFKIRKLKR